jgi:hypothetical protein
MRTTTLAAASLALVCAGVVIFATPAPASAQNLASAIDHGIEASAAIGVARSTGKVASSADHALSYYVPAIVPITLGLGYRFFYPLYVGALLSYGPGFTEHCPDGLDCSANRLVLGIEARGYLPARISPTPLWGSLGFGYESIEGTQSVGGLSASANVDGWQYLSLKLGAEFGLARNFVVAPYVGFDLGQYDSVASGGRSQSIPDNQQSWHTWIGVGARFAYTFPVP